MTSQHCLRGKPGDATPKVYEQLPPKRDLYFWLLPGSIEVQLTRLCSDTWLFDLSCCCFLASRLLVLVTFWSGGIPTPLGCHWLLLLPRPDRYYFLLWGGGDNNFLFGPVLPLPWPKPRSTFYTPILLVRVCAQLVCMPYVNHSCSPHFGTWMLPLWNNIKRRTLINRGVSKNLTIYLLT